MGTPIQGTASSVTVNSSAATLYADQTFAQAGVSLADGTNTFTAVATDSLGRWDTNTVTAYLPATVTFAYDLNGNLRTNVTSLAMPVLPFEHSAAMPNSQTKGTP